MLKKSSCMFLVLLVTMVLSSSIALAGKLFYPHVDTSGGWQTELCAINGGDTKVTVLFRGADKNGKIIETISREIAAHGRIEFNVSKDFSKHQALASVIAESDTDTMYGYTKFFINSQYQGSVSAKNDATDDTLYISHIHSDQQWWTGIGIMNTTNKQISPKIRFDNGTTKQITLNPYQKTAFLVSQMVDEQAARRLKTAIIENAKGAVAFELFGTTGINNSWSLGGITIDGSLVNELYFPHVTTHANSNGQWWTGIAVFNPGNTPANLKVTTVNEAGTVLDTGKTSVPANSKIVGTGEEYTKNPMAAWIKITSDQPVTGFQLFGTTDGKALGGYECNNILLKAGILPKIEQVGWIGVAFVNPGAKTSKLTLKAISNEGVTVSSAMYDLAPGAKIVRLAHDFFTGSIAKAHYIRFEASEDVLAFQLNGSEDGTMLDALAAIPISAGSAGSSIEDGVEEFIEIYRRVMKLAKSMDGIDFSALLEDGLPDDLPIQITPPFESLDLGNLPSNITAVLDCGNGHKTKIGTLSGKVTLRVTNLSVQETGITADVHLKAENFRQDGNPLLNGEGNGKLALKMKGGAIGGSMNITMNRLEAVGGIFNGKMVIDIPSLSLASGMPTAPMTFSFNNFNADGLSISSGKMTVTYGNDGVARLNFGLNTSFGPVNGDADFTDKDDGSFTVNTPKSMVFGPYTVNINNVVSNPGTCTDTPVSGNMIISSKGEKRTVSFTSNCGIYSIE